MKSILTLTLNPAVDLWSTVDQVVPNHKLRCSEPRIDPGGGGLNVSRVIRRLGGNSSAVFCAGGPTGDMLKKLLDSEGVDFLAVPVNGWNRQCLTVSEGLTSQQYRFVMPGPEFTSEEWRRALKVLSETDPFPDFVVASGSLPPGVPDDFYATLAILVRSKESRLILDTSGEALLPAMKVGVFMIKPSLRELQVFASDCGEISDKEQLLMHFVKEGSAEAIVVSLGAAGVLMATRAGCERVAAPVVEVRSQVGAGDSMVAGITAALAQDWSIRDAVRYGIAAGSAAVMNVGTELCHKNDVEMLYRKMADLESKAEGGGSLSRLR